MEKMTDIFSFLNDNYLAIMGILTALVTFASAVANFTKTDSDNKVVAVFAKVVDFLALNFKK